VLAEYGGPIAAVEMGPFPVRGRNLVLANASLRPGLARRPQHEIYSNTADGTGLHINGSIARHMAVSEAMERWAFSALVASDRAADYGFDIDPSSCGMSAYPGLVARQARRRSVLEAIERFSLISWWDGRVEGRVFDTDWPGISAVAIDGPFGGVTVVVYGRTQWGGYVYGHAADESFSGACERAVMELARHEWVMRAWWLSRVAGERKSPTNIFERRCIHFATEDGHREFLEHVQRRPSGPAPRPDVICDTDIPGPWSNYATVWRFALRPPSDGYLRGGDGYFFL
jgi:ribosomal protein S12 methylthiotransferase accessory factor YcaO